ncbi:helix-turn-helix transcriptional regulator [Bacillus sp. JCM 19041]|uniref:helix-turn-helix transcriptional regulator n=1 Tax=Bacillus sp. JCM 19041 TaxID=1460637 RepID=UPI0006D2656F
MRITLKEPDEFKTLLAVKGYSQRSFGRSLGVSESYACQIVNGVRNPGPKTAKKITDLLNVEFDDIFLVNLITKVSK